MLKHHLRSHPDRNLGDMAFTFSIKSHFSSAFRRQVGEAVAIKMSIADPKVLNLNSKLEYNRCLISDILDLDSPEKTQEEHKLDEKMIKLKKLGTEMWESWKKLGGGMGPMEKRRLPKMTPEALLQSNPKQVPRYALDRLLSGEDRPPAT